MKKKIITFALILFGLATLSACGKTKLNLADYCIEKRCNLFTASDSNYTISLSTGKREENYSLDGVVGNMVDFGVVTFSRLDKNPMANDTYHYDITIGEEVYSGDLIKSDLDNTYSVDLGIALQDDAEVSAKVSFTGYTFEQNLISTSQDFSVGADQALGIATKELNESVNNVMKDHNNIEVVMKILKDYSTSDVKAYYWYVGVISTDGQTMGILIDANTSNIIAKKI